MYCIFVFHYQYHLNSNIKFPHYNILCALVFGIINSLTRCELEKHAKTRVYVFPSSQRNSEICKRRPYIIAGLLPGSGGTPEHCPLYYYHNDIRPFRYRFWPKPINRSLIIIRSPKIYGMLPHYTYYGMLQEVEFKILRCF